MSTGIITRERRSEDVGERSTGARFQSRREGGHRVHKRGGLDVDRSISGQGAQMLRVSGHFLLTASVLSGT